jgi:DNA-binding MarR family transcriptional regulator
VEFQKIAAQPSGSNQISRQVEHLRDQLRSAQRIADELAGPPAATFASHAVAESHVRTLLKLRRQRDRFFDNRIFADPAWDILLELYAAELGQFRVSVSNLCRAAAVPETTALRWIRQLEDGGLIDRRSDPTDGRRQFLKLSDKAAQAMNAYFRTVPAGAPLI